MAMEKTQDEVVCTACWDQSISFREANAGAPDLRRFKCGLLDRDAALAAARNLPEFIAGLPKAELHIHVEGALTSAFAHRVAVRNGLDTADLDPEAGAAARRDFRSLVPFLMERNKCDAVMRTEEDFYDLMMEYLTRAAEENVRHAEIFFDPQVFCFTNVSGTAAEGQPHYDAHGVGEAMLPIETVIDGLHRALEEGRARLGVDGRLILCFLRDRSAEEAHRVLDLALPHLGKLLGVGLDNAEFGHRPSKFADVFARARGLGLRCVAHAGEEGDASYVTEALDLLKVERIDHGVRSLEDPAVVERLRAAQTPLTVCPCSNHRLQVYPRFFCGENAVRQLVDAGLKVTLNSDDPAYFFMGNVDPHGRAVDAAAIDGYLNSNFVRTARDCSLSPDELVALARNSFESSFLAPEELKAYIAELEAYCSGWRPTRSSCL